MHPRLRHLLPATRENNWTDLLASFVETDPTPLLGVLGQKVQPVRVRREVVAARLDDDDTRRVHRLDLLIESIADGSYLAAIEAKVLAPLGPDQLDRYGAAFSQAASLVLLQLSKFHVAPPSTGWRSVTWEDVLGAYTTSTHRWVAETAAAWLFQIEQLIPQVDQRTVWREVRDNLEGDIDLRARGAWLHAAMSRWCTVSPGFEAADGGRSWVVTMEERTSIPDYSIYVEVDEGLPVRRWNHGQADMRPRAERLRGPTALVTLAKTSGQVNDFDWALLVRAFRGLVFDSTGEPVEDGRTWRRTRARASQRPGWNETVRDSATVPVWLGHGYDMTKNGWRCFGARFDLSPDLTLGQIDAELQRLEPLVRAISSNI